MSRSLAAAAVALAWLVSSPALAVDKCKVRVDKKTGDILVSASPIVGNPLWGGGQPDDPGNPFDEILSCTKAGKLKNCRLGPSGTPLARRATASCEISIRDDAGLCRTRIPGCSAAPVLAATVTEVVSADNWQLGRSIGAVAVVKGGPGQYEVEFERAIDNCIPSVTMTEEGTANACVHCGTTNRHLTVTTHNLAGGYENLRFYVTVTCP